MVMRCVYIKFKMKIYYYFSIASFFNKNASLEPNHQGHKAFT